MNFFRLHNVIQNYAWGTKDALNSLFDITNTNNQPQAEIWMGAHPNGCSKITVNNKEILLSDFISSDMKHILGEKTAKKFGELPYLFKILSAEKALSVQVHPSKKQAELGFLKEESINVPLSAGFRNYKDPNHKPELVYALTPYQAMNGFREYPEILGFFHQLQIDEIATDVSTFQKNQTENGLSHFFKTLLSLNKAKKDICVAKLLAFAKTQQTDSLYALIQVLAEQYPGDIGLFSPLLLNTLTLLPGEAMFLDANTPHAYIKGTGLEIMANSDNVLRAGLTPKHIDVPELIANTRCIPIAQKNLRLKPKKDHNAEHYPVPVNDFKFSIYHHSNNMQLNTQSAEILIAIDAPLTLDHLNEESITLQKGESVFIPAYAKQYLASCNGTFARAYN